MKACTTCYEIKEFNAFYKVTRSVDGYGWTCKPCYNIYQKSSRDKNPEEYRRKQREWLAKNPEAAKRNRVSNRIWIAANKERFAETRRKWYVKNKERHCKVANIYYHSSKNVQERKNELRTKREYGDYAEVAKALRALNKEKNDGKKKKSRPT